MSKMKTFSLFTIPLSHFSSALETSQPKSFREHIYYGCWGMQVFDFPVIECFSLLPISHSYDLHNAAVHIPVAELLTGMRKL